MTEGYKIIKELRKRGLKGYYFSYSQVNKLSRIKEFDEAKNQLIDWGFESVKECKNTVQVVDRIIQDTIFSRSEKKGCLFYFIAEPILLLLLFLGGCLG